MKHQFTMNGISTANHLLKHSFIKPISNCCLPHRLLVNSASTSVIGSNAPISHPGLPNCTSYNFVPKRWGSQVPTASSSLGPNFTKAQAVLLIEKLTSEERKLFLKELKKVVVTKPGEVLKPTLQELKQLAYHNSLPFIGFGFLDNFIMIMAGEYIDITLGAKLGISTMAAAAFGNTISDMMGVGSAWYVESWADRLGAHPPDLTPDQLEMPSSRISANLGRCLGVAFGCLLGMFPLLFINTSGNEEAEKEQEKP
eukprot:TRINITY_DN9101_c0_g1_i2.p1 TRINITY_DN9101_c0_g1~~TRINITY_DN9101_c0_g1_i2.p1  ORF type:complete len:255 (-),score=45.61 TRINITY_DN9101_c0_g1_i2:486-1250(-)